MGKSLNNLNNVLRKRTKSGRPRKTRKDKGKKRGKSIATQMKELKLARFKAVQNGK